MWISGLIQNPVGTHFSDTELQAYGIEGYTDNIDDEGRPILRLLILLMNNVDRS